MTTEDLDYMMPGEVAALLGVTRRTIKRWADSGRLPHVKTIGGHRRFPRREIEALATPTYRAGTR